MAKLRNPGRVTTAICLLFVIAIVLVGSVLYRVAPGFADCGWKTLPVSTGSTAKVTTLEAPSNASFMEMLIDAATHAHMDRLDTLKWVTTASDAIKAQGMQMERGCELYGLPYIDSWRARKEQFCSTEDPQGSQLWGYLKVVGDYSNYSTPRKAGKVYNVMVSEGINMVLDSQNFTTDRSKERYQDSITLPRQGSLKAACKIAEDSNAWQHFTMADSTRAVMRGALQANQVEVVEQACQPGAKNIIEHPVLLLQRYDSTNAFHNMEDVVTVFIALAVLNSTVIKEKGLQIFIVDAKSVGFYPEIWERISFPHPVRFLRDDPLPPGTCLRHTVTIPWGAHSLLTDSGFFMYPQLKAEMGDKFCKSPIFVACSNWLRSLFPEITELQRGFKVALQTHQDDQQIVTHTVVWITRRNYESIAAKSWSNWQTNRMINNENQLLDAVHHAILEWNDEACFRVKGAGLKGPTTHIPEQCRDKRVVYELQIMELSDVSFYPDQLQRLTRMKILGGIHGAAMANLIWMKPFSGGVVEVGHNSGGQPHYVNMADAMGHIYMGVSSGGQAVNVDATVKTLKDMMNRLA